MEQWLATTLASGPESRAGFERVPLCVGATQHGLLWDRVMNPHGLGQRNEGLAEWAPYLRLQRGETLPKRLWIMHGGSDTVVHVEQSERLQELVRQHAPGTEVRLDIVAGQDHGFDLLFPGRWSDVQEKGVEFATKAWLE